MEFSRSEQKILRDLAGDVYEAEARELLEQLAESFDLWREGEKLSSELLSDIHEFHQHESRDLWSKYQGMDKATIVARGVGLGFLDQDRVPPGILKRLNVGYWREAEHKEEP